MDKYKQYLAIKSIFFRLKLTIALVLLHLLFVCMIKVLFFLILIFRNFSWISSIIAAISIIISILPFLLLRPLVFRSIIPFIPMILMISLLFLIFSWTIIYIPIPIMLWSMTLISFIPTIFILVFIPAIFVTVLIPTILVIIWAPIRPRIPLLCCVPIFTIRIFKVFTIILRGYLLFPFDCFLFSSWCLWAFWIRFWKPRRIVWSISRCMLTFLLFLFTTSTPSIFLR